MTEAIQFLILGISSCAMLALAALLVQIPMLSARCLETGAIRTNPGAASGPNSPADSSNCGDCCASCACCHVHLVVSSPEMVGSPVRRELPTAPGAPVLVLGVVSPADRPPRS